MHNFSQQRRNMTNHCVEGGKESDDPFASNFWDARITRRTAEPYTAIDPAARNAWGVDLNRNNTVGTIFDGYIGASYSCISDVYTGPARGLRAGDQERALDRGHVHNIKFSNNIHSFGGYFMWAPGTYLPDRGEGDAVHANIGVEKYFFDAGDRILNRIKEHRNTAILPERTGPIADVLYSAAGNSADEHWYNRDVIAYSFETGADLFFTTLAVGRRGRRDGDPAQPNRAGSSYLKPGDKLASAPAGRTRRRGRSPRSSAEPAEPQPNVLLTAAAHERASGGGRIEGAALQTGVGFQPDYATEGKHEALEFAAGNYGLLESALEYARDDEDAAGHDDRPEALERADRDDVRVDERAVGDPLHDGRVEARPSLDAVGLHRPARAGQVFHLTETTTFRWIATDIKGNVSPARRSSRSAAADDRRQRDERPAPAGRSSDVLRCGVNRAWPRLGVAPGLLAVGVALAVALRGEESEPPPGCVRSISTTAAVRGRCRARLLLARVPGRGGRPGRPAAGGGRGSATSRERGRLPALELPRRHAHGRPDLCARRRGDLASLMDYLPPTTIPAAAPASRTGSSPASRRTSTRGAGRGGAACAGAGTRFQRYSCVHGFGHAFMRLYEDQLEPALELCVALGRGRAPTARRAPTTTTGSRSSAPTTRRSREQPSPTRYALRRPAGGVRAPLLVPRLPRDRPAASSSRRRRTSRTSARASTASSAGMRDGGGRDRAARPSPRSCRSAPRLRDPSDAATACAARRWRTCSTPRPRLPAADRRLRGFARRGARRVLPAGSGGRSPC